MYGKNSVAQEENTWGYTAIAFLPFTANADTSVPLYSPVAHGLQTHKKSLATLGASLCIKDPLKAFDVEWEEASFFS